MVLASEGLARRWIGHFPRETGWADDPPASGFSGPLILRVHARMLRCSINAPTSNGFPCPAGNSGNIRFIVGFQGRGRRTALVVFFAPETGGSDSTIAEDPNRLDEDALARGIVLLDPQTILRAGTQSLKVSVRSIKPNVARCPTR